MTLEQANKKLIIARKKKEKLTEEIKALTNFIRKNKIDIRLSIGRRNRGIYKLSLKPMSYEAISLHYKLSIAQIANICKHFEKQEKKEAKVQAFIEKYSR